MGLLSQIFGRRNTFTHGVHPQGYKSATREMPIRRLPFAPRMIVPLSQHKGKPALPIVRPGQEVVRGEPIAQADGFISVPMHSPVTGIVERIDLVTTAEGPKTRAIIIRTYQSDTQRVLYDCPQEINRMSPQEFVEAVQNSGMVGLGGAAFPSHVKLLPPQGRRIDTVIVNGCECEPYLTCDHRTMLEKTDELLQGVRMVLRMTGAEQAIIGIEDNKLDAVAKIRSRLGNESKIRVEVMPTKYPQGAEKMVVKSLLGKEIPSGGLPVDIGVAVYNVATLTQLGELLPESRGLIERVVTVSGAGVERPGNYLVPIGTPLRFLMQQVGSSAEASQIILGGPMMGMSVASLDVPITKGVSGILVLAKPDIGNTRHRVYPCIGCGKCVDACALHLNPSLLGQLASSRQYELMETRYHLNDCFECGSCSYVCPSNIPLTQYFRIAKAINREAKAKRAATDA